MAGELEMSSYELAADCYVLPTPAGAFYAASGTSQDVARSLLFMLLSESFSQQIALDRLCTWTKEISQDDALDLLYRMQTLGWIQGEEEERQAPEGQLVETLPMLLPELSSSNKALLADQQGFYLATHGFSHETAEELSALSADLAALHQRHRGLLENNIGLNSAAWAIVDGSANGQLGFWPLFIGNQRFVLVLAGMPRLNQPAFVNLIWLLNKRYSSPAEQALSLSE